MFVLLYFILRILYTGDLTTYLAVYLGSESSVDEPATMSKGDGDS